MAFLLKHYLFSAKIRNLNEFYQQITTGQHLPSGLDIVNTLRYFQQTLLGLLRDVNINSLETCLSDKGEASRISLFPNLNYGGLYHALINVIDIYPMITNGQIALGCAILNTVQCLYLFIERELAEQLPFTVASLLTFYPTELQPEVLRLLCNILLPFVLANDQGDSFATASIAGVVLMVFQFCKDPRHHTWLLETLLSLRNDVYKVVLSVIAYGTTDSRIPAANLLFHYWPLAKSVAGDRRTVQYRIHAWTPTRCQHKDCSSGDDNLSSRKCYNSSFCAEFGDSPPPLFLCSNCAKNVPENIKSSVHPYCQPLSALANVCQNKECSSNNRIAVCICFSDVCLRMNNYVPLRLCQKCHDRRHADVQHICLAKIPKPWDCDKKTYCDMVVAIVSLLKETSIMLDMVATEKLPKWLQQLEGGSTSEQQKEMADERRMLSRYGIWMLTELCELTPEVPAEAVGHLLSMLFLWFCTTALLPSDSIGTNLEQLKNEFACTWLRTVLQTHAEVFIQCLLPDPPNYAKVGGSWDKMSKRSEQLKEGLSKILALIPYDLISYETWERIMPVWFEVISMQISEADLGELKVLLCKIFEVNLCSLSFPPQQIYHFIEVRLASQDYREQAIAVRWLQLLTDIDILIPLEVLLNLLKCTAENVPTLLQTKTSFFKTSKEPSIEPEALDDEILPISPPSSDEIPVHQQTILGPIEDTNITLFVFMLDVLLKQVELWDVPKNQGVEPALMQNVLIVLTAMMKANWSGIHVCENPDFDDFADCMYCRVATIFCQLLVETVQNMCPKWYSMAEVSTAYTETKVINHGKPGAKPTESTGMLAPSSLGQKDESTASTSAASAPAADGAKGAAEKPNGVLKTAVIQEESSPLEFVGILPTEEPEIGVAETVTLTEKDVDLATCKVVTTMLIDEHENDEGAGQSSPALTQNFWQTSVGNFRFCLEDSHGQLQLLYYLMNDIESFRNPDVIYYKLQAVKYLCLHGKSLSNINSDERGFLIWAQENILIPKFWALLQAQYSQIAEICTPLILHCLNLPSGADTYWKLVDDDFTSNDPMVRFAAVEKVSSIFWFTDPAVLQDNLTLQGSLAFSFAFLIAATADPDSSVAQRALMYISTIKQSSLMCLCSCMEAQFDNVVSDRSLIIERFRVLSRILPDVPVLSWDFFLTRFDVLSVEAQISLERTGKIAFPVDLFHSDPLSESYQKKLSHARRSRESGHGGGASVRSISIHLNQSLRLKRGRDLKLHKPTYQKNFAFGKNEREPSCVSAAMSGKMKLRKVMTLVRVVHVWNGLRKRLSSSLSSLSSLVSLSRAPSPTSSERNRGHSALSSYLADYSLSGNDSLDPNITGVKNTRDSDGDSNYYLIFNKAIDIDNPQRETMALLMDLFMQFLANPKASLVNVDEKSAAKKQSLVLRHLNLLLGYNATDKCFSVPPHRLRCSALCMSFLMNLPRVLESNLFLAHQILPLATSLLIYLPSPQRSACEAPPQNYTLWYLDPHVRHCWLWSLLLIFYKGQFNHPPVSDTIMSLVNIVISTLDAHIHVCEQVQISQRHRSFSSESSSDASDSMSTDVEELGELPSSSTMAVAASMVGCVRYGYPPTAMFRHKRRLPQRRPTFDEREEHMLEVVDSLQAQHQLDGGEQTADALTEEPVPKVDSRIREQIEEFDKSFTSKEELEPVEVSSQTAKSEESTASDTWESSPLQDFPSVKSAIVKVMLHSEEPGRSEVAGSAIEVLPRAVCVQPQIVIDEFHELQASGTKQSAALHETLVKKGKATKSRPVTENLVQRMPLIHKESRLATERKDDSALQPMSFAQVHFSETTIYQRCPQCNATLELFDEDTIAMSVICLSTFISREPDMAAPCLLRILTAVAKIAHRVYHPWQADSAIFVPGNCRSVARQFLRVILHQLTPNHLFLPLFQSEVSDPSFFKTIAQSLTDFQELNPLMAAQYLLQDITDRACDNLDVVLTNLASFLSAISVDAYFGSWVTVVTALDNCFRTTLANAVDIANLVPSVFSIINRVFKVHNFYTIKAGPSILETVCKFLSRLLQAKPVDICSLLALSSSCNRAFLKERDRHAITRCCLNELTQALKFKHNLHESNYMTIIKMILHDYGETAGVDIDDKVVYVTNASECVKVYLQDFIDFVQDSHVLHRMKVMARESGALCEDTLGGELKVGLSKYIAYEIYRATSRDARSMYRYLPWLLSPPPITQLGANEFVDCVGRVRLLSWILLGSLSCTGMTPCLPIPIDSSQRISDLIQFVFAGFAELSKESVLNMSALFHAFHLCQLWTVYCEEAFINSSSETVKQEAMANVMDFWSRITPAILQLLSHSKMLADMVNLHFLNTVEGLLECDSVVLTKLFPMWHPILVSYHCSIPSHLLIRLDFCENYLPTDSKRRLVPWLKHIGFKISQVEFQSSAATQFYSV